VILQGFGSLVTNNPGPSAIVMTANVPAGVPAGRYNVEVLNQDGECGVLNRGLRVNAPPAPVTEVPTSTPQPTDFIRPLVTVLSYVPSTQPPLYPGQEFDFAVTLRNTGQLVAKNIIVEFPVGDVLPRNTGGTRTIGDLAPGQTVDMSQPLRVDSNLNGYEAVVTINISYTDQYGNPYSESNVLSFEAGQYASTPTPTATLSVRPQLIVEGYTTSPDPLTPGTTFTLNITLTNVSGEIARQVVATLGGIGEQGGSTTGGTTTTSDVTSLSTSNIRYIDQLMAGQATTLTYQLIVSGEAEGGLVPLDLQLVYIDNYNVEHTDTATISLPVHAVPHLQIHLFEPLPDLIQVGDTFDIPIEVINIGTSSVNISMMEITNVTKLRITDSSIYVGPLDAGTTSTLTASAEALQAGTATFDVTVHYLDSFQQEQTVTQSFQVTIEAIPLDSSGENGTARPGSSDDSELSLGERLLRAVLGFFGLGTRPVEDTISLPAGGGTNGGPGGGGGPQGGEKQP